MDTALQLKSLAQEGKLADLIDDVKNIDEIVGLLNFHITKLLIIINFSINNYNFTSSFLLLLADF